MTTTYDVHQHLWPEAFVAALRERRTPPLLDGDELETREGRFAIDLAEHGLEARLRALDRDGIDVAVLSLQPSLALEELAGRRTEGARRCLGRGNPRADGERDGKAPRVLAVGRA